MIEAIFNPKTVAIIGATERENSVGRGIVENLKRGKRKLFYVNLKGENIFGEKSYQKITDIKEDIDLAVIAVPKVAVSNVVDDCIEKGVKGIIIISAGFAETGKEGKELQDEISKKIKDAGTALVGPNCLGIIRPAVALNASFAPGNPKEGDIAFISQSGALIDAVIDGAEKENYGFSLIISVGNAGGITLTDYIKIADDDENTKVIALYIEGLENGRDFFDTLKSTKKPIVIIKAGKEEKAKKAIASHTGSLAGEYRIFSSAIKQAGAIEANSLEELFDVAKALSWQGKIKKEIGIVTNGGGAGVLLTDSLYEFGFVLPELKEETIQKINSKEYFNSPKENPLDVLGDALPNRFEVSCSALMEQDNISGIVVIQTPQIMTNCLENARKIVTIQKQYKKPVITVFMGAGEKTKEAISLLEENKIPNYSDPKRAGVALRALLNKK
jgi:acetyltransferase